MSATETRTKSATETTDDIEWFPTCAICLEDNVEDSGEHHDATGHAPVAPPVYTTRAEAIAGEILAPLEASAVSTSEFDVEAIAAVVLSDHENGYRRTLGHDQFWQTVGANLRQELPVHIDADDSDGPQLRIGAPNAAAAVESLYVAAQADERLGNALTAQRLQAAGWTITTVTPQGAPATVRRSAN